MANELNIALSTGLTVTAQRYQSGAAVGSAISCPETGSTGFYSGNMTGAAGTYQLAFLAAGANVGSGSIVWDGTNEVASSAPSVVQIRQEMDTNSTQLSAIKVKTDNLPADPADQSLLEAAIAGVTAPSAGQVASQVRTELSGELAKVAALNTERLANVATTAIVGNLIAQANS